MKNYEVKAIIETGAECVDIIPDDSEIMADSVEEAIDCVICDLMEQAIYSDYNAERYDNYKLVIYDQNNNAICVYKFRARLTFDNKEIEGAEWEEPEYCDTVTDTTEEAKKDIVKRYKAEGLTEAGKWVPLFNDLIDNAETAEEALYIARGRMLKKGSNINIRVRAYYSNRITCEGRYSHSWTEQPKAVETTQTTEATTETEQPKAEETTQTTEATTETEQPKAEETEATETKAEPKAEETAQTTETTEAMTITLTINMDENNELLKTIEAYKIEIDFLRRMVAKALKAEAEARAEVRKLKQTTEATAQTTEPTQATTETEQPKAEEPTQATTETPEATPPTEATGQPAETKTPEATPPTEATAQPAEETAQTTGVTPPPTEATGKEVTGVPIIEYRQYNNGDKVIIKHNCFYNADEIIDNYHATDPSYICKYKGLMFGKDENEYYVSEFHHEEQYL